MALYPTLVCPPTRYSVGYGANCLSDRVMSDSEIFMDFVGFSQSMISTFAQLAVSSSLPESQQQIRRGQICQHMEGFLALVQRVYVQRTSTSIGSLDMPSNLGHMRSSPEASVSCPVLGNVSALRTPTVQEPMAQVYEEDKPVYTVDQPLTTLPKHHVHTNDLHIDFACLPTPDPSLSTPEYSGFSTSDDRSALVRGAKADTEVPELVNLGDATYREPFHDWPNWNTPTMQALNPQF